MKNLDPDLFAVAPAPTGTTRKRARLSKLIGITLAVAVFVAAIVHFTGDMVLDHLVRPTLEKTFAAHLPGCALRLGALRFDLLRNRLECHGLSATLPHGARASVGFVSVQGVNWGRSLAGHRDVGQLASTARIELKEISAVLPTGQYRVQCGLLRVSMPDAEISAQALSLRTVMSDEAFFAADAFRRIRYRLDAASCTLRGVGLAELLHGQGFRVRSMKVVGPILESLVDQEKPRRPLTARPLMPQEMLAALGMPVRIDQLTITNGTIKYAGRRSAGADPGVLTFTAVQITASDIANAAGGGQVIGLLAEGRLMDAGAMTVQMRIPVAASSPTFHYAGKLSAMDLTRLEEYMSGAGRFQIRSGRASEASFDIDVVDGRARGVLKGAYHDLQVKIVDRETGSEKGVTNRVATVLANHLKVRENLPDKAGTSKEGKIDYSYKPDESFLQFAWLALRSGILDLISL